MRKDQLMEGPLVIGRIIGEVLDPFTSSVSLRVVYKNQTEVINSCELKPSQIVNKPRVHIGGDDLRVFYTLVCMLPTSIFFFFQHFFTLSLHSFYIQIMVNPDAPSPSHPSMKEYLHWSVCLLLSS